MDASFHRTFEQMLDDGVIIIKTNPCLRWNAASAVTEADQKENRIFAKKKSTGRIDGVVASAMAMVLQKVMSLMMAI